MNGRFTFRRPARVDHTIDLEGTWIVPLFGEAHNHNIGTGVEQQERAAIQRYLADRVFYVKVQGNLPMLEYARGRLPINRPDQIDVLGQGSLTAMGGHPIALLNALLTTQGQFPGHTAEALKDLHYFTIDSEADLERKWPLVIGHRPQFIKTFLMFSEEFEKRRNDPAYFGRKGLDPRLLAGIVARAHERGLRVSTHVNTAADFHNAVAAGVEEITHLPPLPGRNPEDAADTPLSVDDVMLAAKRGVVVITTLSLALNAPPAVRGPWRQRQEVSLKLLRDRGVKLAIGSDNPADSSLGEVQYVKGLGVLDNLTLLKMWTETTVATIFPSRSIGALREGYEASFLALEGNPLADFENVRRIRHWFKQGFVLQTIR